MAEYNSFQSRYSNPYDYLREKASQQTQQQKQEEQDALQRRFAQMGTLQSGAALKVGQQASDLADKRAMDAQNAIGFQEAQEKSGQQYQTSEREAQQSFQRGLVESDQAFKGKYADLDNEYRNREFMLNQQATTLNAAVALKNAGLSPGDINSVNESLKRLGINYTFGVPGGGSSGSGSSIPGGGSVGGGDGGGYPSIPQSEMDEFSADFRSVPAHARDVIQKFKSKLSPQQQQVFMSGFDPNSGRGWEGLFKDARILGYNEQNSYMPGVNYTGQQYLENKYGRIL